MLANTASKVSKVGWMDILSVSGYMTLLRDELNGVLTNLGMIGIYGEAVDDMDSTNTGSQFLTKLNNVTQPQNISYYGIIGTVGNPMNWVISGDYFGGDCIVKKSSQLGAGKVFYRQSSQIHSNHWREPEIAAKETDNKILQFLDSTPPEFTLDTPQENSTTEINTNSISIKGKVYKEYLPADSEIIISGLRQEDGAALNQINAPLKPSSLWIPNNPDSPVAEFDETIPFPGEGAYKISCQIKNPAGLTSDTKVFWVKVVLLQPNANIIVHGYNPEGKEINSIPGFTNSVAVYDGSIRIGHAGSTPITIPSGYHTINVKFNGMTLTQEIDIVGGETRQLIFEFTRTSISNSEILSLVQTDSGNWNDTIFGGGYNVSGGSFSATILAWPGSAVSSSLVVTNNINVTSWVSTAEATVVVSGPAFIRHLEVVNNGEIRGNLNIPLQLFTEWYAQNYISGNGKVISEIDSSGFSLTSHHNPITGEPILGYTFHAYPASTPFGWGGAIVFSSSSSLYSSPIFPNYAVSEATGIVSDTRIVDGARLKFSSVPYDPLDL